MPSADLRFREGRSAHLRPTYELYQKALHAAALERGALPQGSELDEGEVAQAWRRHKELLEFAIAQPGGSFWVCEEQGGTVVGYARATEFGGMQELTELAVGPDHRGRGIGRALLQRCWPDDPTPQLGRVVVGAGTIADLGLYTEFGAMPATGHWQMRARAKEYLEHRSHELDATEPSVHVLKADRAAAEWKRLEPHAIGHERPQLHDFFGRTRTCLASFDKESGAVIGLCWVSGDGEIGPAVGAAPADLVPVVLAALDRVAKSKEPESFDVYCTTDAWWLLRRLRMLGFQVWWPSWVMCSVPLPGLDRYLPTHPSYLL